MAKFTNYIIAQTDPRFPEVFDEWCTNMVCELVQKDLTSSFAETFCFLLSQENGLPERVLLKDLQKVVKVLNQSRFENVWVGYSTSYLGYASMISILDNYNKRRRRKDYQIQAATAFALTTVLAVNLLDKPIPDLNIMGVTYAGLKGHCFG